MNYANHLFISYAAEQQDDVSGLVRSLRKADLSVWWADDIAPGDYWRERINDAIDGSRHLLLYCTVNAKASDMVGYEVQRFLAVARSDPSRRLFVLRAPDCKDKDIPAYLKDRHYSTMVDEVIIEIQRVLRHELTRDLERLRATSVPKNEMEEALAKERLKVSEARRYFGHRRFWDPFAANDDLRIFAGGRDIQPDANRPRGTGGYRTNIDKWDYRAVLGLTHFFASNYPSVKLTIEDPASKLQREDIASPHALANRIAEVSRLLEDKDCVIVGSPVVNDFAEIVLSKIHGVDPFDDSRRKSRGFVLVREKKNAGSTFYWEAREGEQEGIARLGGQRPFAYEHVSPTTGGAPSSVGTMHGLLVVAENPFGTSVPKRRIMILSGFSGVATDAMTKFLTEHTYLESFFEFDEAYSRQGPTIEAVIRVRYRVEPESGTKDRRLIAEGPESISFEELVPV